MSLKSTRRLVSTLASDIRQLVSVTDTFTGHKSVGWLQKYERRNATIELPNGRTLSAHESQMTLSIPATSTKNLDRLLKKAEKLQTSDHLLGLYSHFTKKGLFGVGDASQVAFGSESVEHQLATHNYLLSNPMFFTHETTAMAGVLAFQCRSEIDILMYQRAIVAMRSQTPELIQFIRRASKILTSQQPTPFQKSDEMFLRLLSGWSVKGEFRHATEDPVSNSAHKLLSAFPRYPVSVAGCRAFLTDIGYYRRWDCLGSLPLLQLSEVTRNSAGVVDMRDRDEPYRHDFGDLVAFAVDDFNVTEVDDAFSVEHNSHDDTTWVHVHIADPTSSLDLNHPLARRAFEQASTVYMPEQMIPMFNSESHLKLWSLEEGKLNRTLTMSVKLSADGQILDRKLRLGLVNRLMQIPYDDYDRILEQKGVNSLFKYPQNEFYYTTRYIDHPEPDSKMPALSKDIVDALVKMDEVMFRYAQRRYQREHTFTIASARPSLSLSRTSENQALFPCGVHQRLADPHPKLHLYVEVMHQSPARQIIAESMILAGSNIASIAQDAKIPFIYRSQPALRDELRHKLGPKDLVGRLSIPDSMKIVPLLETSVSSTNGLPHELMGLDMYSHATSPLRRVTDLINHYQIKSSLTQKKAPFSEQELSSLIPVLTHRVQRIRRAQFASNMHWGVQWLIQNSYRTFSAYVFPTGEQEFESGELDAAFEKNVFIKELGAKYRMSHRQFLREPEDGSWVKVKLFDIDRLQMRPIFKQVAE